MNSSEKCKDDSSVFIAPPSKDSKFKESNDHRQPSMWTRFKREVKPDRKLLKLKFLTCLFYGGMFSMTPFISMHMKQVGLTNVEVGIVTVVTPITGILGALISGALADWSTIRVVLTCDVAMSALTHFALAFIPPVAIPDQEEVLQLTSQFTAVSQLHCTTHTTAMTSGTPWIIDTNCFEDLGKLQTTNNNPLIVFCEDFSPRNQVREHACKLPVEEDCFKYITFLTRNVTIMDYNLKYSSSLYNDQVCLVNLNRTTVEGVEETTSHISNSKTFWAYLVLSSAGSFFSIASFRMMDASIFAVIKREGGDYGKQRMVVMFCLAITPFMSSLIVSARSGPSDYSVVFYIGTVILLAAIVMIQFNNLTVEKQADKNYTEELKLLFSQKKILFFLSVILTLGLNWGFLAVFLFIHLRSMGAEPYLFGIMTTFGSALGIPTLLIADRVMEFSGRERLFFLAFMGYTVRMIGYSYITNPWFSVLVQLPEMFTYHLVWVCAMTYLPSIAPLNVLGTLSAISGTTHFTLGKGLGSLIGGFITSRVGMNWTFRIFGITTFFLGLLYLFIQRRSILKYNSDAKSESCSVHPPESVPIKE